MPNMETVVSPSATGEEKTAPLPLSAATTKAPEKRKERKQPKKPRERKSAATKKAHKTRAGNSDEEVVVHFTKTGKTGKMSRHYFELFKFAETL